MLLADLLQLAGFLLSNNDIGKRAFLGYFLQLIGFFLSTNRFVKSLYTSTLIARGNVPTDISKHIRSPWLGWEHEPDTIWVSDRILPKQTIPHFIECAISGHLPSGEMSTLPRLTPEDVQLFYLPLSQWALPPYNENNLILLHEITAIIMALENGSRVKPISRELHVMKSRIWEGVMPLSERRWRELQLDDPENLSAACQQICAVINVFHYLNTWDIRVRMIHTYNEIWDRLKTYEIALNAKKEASGEPPVPVSDLWQEYIEALFEAIVGHAHNWVITHIDRLLTPIIAELPEPAIHSFDSFLDHFEKFMNLGDKIHDVVENAAQADTAIFLSMDGYKGANPYMEENVSSLFQTVSDGQGEPIKFSTSPAIRKRDYYGRLNYLRHLKTWTSVEDINHYGDALPLKQEILTSGKHPANSAYRQLRAQNRARKELRGETKLPEQLIWVSWAKRGSIDGELALGTHLTGYRSSHDHTDEEWEDFKMKFEADTSNWGEKLNGIEDLKLGSTVIWEDARDLNISDGDIEALKNHFKTLEETGAFPEKDYFLVADKDVIDSYIAPSPKQGGFVRAVDAIFGDEGLEGHMWSIAGGFDGSLRVLGSLLWEDVMPLLMMQTLDLEDLWPMAMQHPFKVYEGPLV